MMAMIQPRKHCAWYKALLIRNLLKAEGDIPRPTNWKYLVWIDADAIVMNFHQSIEGILHNHFVSSHSLPSSPPFSSSQSIFSDLIISQDFSSSSSCPLNTGVMIIQRTPWSQSLWEDVWCHPSCEKYHHVYFYDQSALIKCLKLRNVHLPSCCLVDETMTESSPHKKNIPRVQILPCALLNSNRISPRMYRQNLQQDHTISSTLATISIQQLIPSSAKGDDELENLDQLPELSDVDRELTEGIKVSSSCNLLENGANFIFHAVGGWNKMKAILRVCQLHGLLSPQEINSYRRSNGIEFRLYRGKCGGVPSRGPFPSITVSKDPRNEREN